MRYEGPLPQASYYKTRADADAAIEANRADWAPNGDELGAMSLSAFPMTTAEWYDLDE